MEKWFRGPVLGAFFILTVGVGVQLSMRSWNGVVYFQGPDAGRDPATFDQPLNVAELRLPQSRANIAASLARDIQMDLIPAPLKPEQKVLLLTVSQPRMRDSSGRQSLACRQFKKMEFIFTTDHAVSGEVSSMIVTAPCAPTPARPSRFGNYASTEDKIRISVPMSDIFKSKTNSTDWTFDEGRIQVTFFNLGDSWPSNYFLKSVRYYNPGDRPTDLQHSHTDHVGAEEASFSSESVTGLQVDFPNYKEPIGFSWKP